MAEFSRQAGLSIAGFPATLHTFQDMERVYSSFPEPDPNWTTTDTQGHEHYYDRGYPTLEWVVAETYWCGMCRDQHEEWEYRCRKCGEPVRPETRMPDPSGVAIPGLKQVELVVDGDAGEEFVSDITGDRLRYERVSVDSDAVRSVYRSVGSAE